MYRILDANQEVRERRNQRRHPVYQKPELLATGPNRSVDMGYNEVEGPTEVDLLLHLYVILDIFSRQVVGWMVADCESASLAKKLIRESCLKQLGSPGSTATPSRSIRVVVGQSRLRLGLALLRLSDFGVTKSQLPAVWSDDYSRSAEASVQGRSSTGPTSRNVAVSDPGSPEVSSAGISSTAYNSRPDLRIRVLELSMDFSDGAQGRSSHAHALYPVLVHRLALLLHASFRPRLAAVALALR